jgi:hypothetical protein
MTMDPTDFWDSNDFQHYQFTEMASILSLNGTWKFLQEKLNEKISKIISFDYDAQNTLQNGLDDFNELISKINSRTDEPRLKKAKRQTTSKQGTTRYARNSDEMFDDYIEDYFNWQSKKIDDVLIKLPEIYSTVLGAFLTDVTFVGDRANNSPSIVKFNAYNLERRFPQDNAHNKLESGICDFEYGFSLYKDRDTKYKQHLMQGFDGVNFMIQSLRNGSVHKKDKDAPKILKNDLKRRIEDPITGAESFGNIITLCSVLTLCAYQFDEIIQTWIDTTTMEQSRKVN